jgi:four helix bundle protein
MCDPKPDNPRKNLRKSRWFPVSSTDEHLSFQQGENPYMNKAEELQDRLNGFSVIVVNICSRMPKTVVGSHIATQLLRSGTAAAANYAEAGAAESAKDFVHKLRVVLKELNESLTWLELIKRTRAQPCDFVQPAIMECTSLCRIIAASINTASGKIKQET